MRHGLLLLAAMLPLSASAQGFGALRWDYVSASLVVPELDELGMELEGSTAVTANLVVFGAFSDYEPENDLKRRTLEIAVGRRWNIRPNIDVLASIGYADNEVERGNTPADEEGIVVGLHVRGWSTSQLELNGAVLLDNSLGSNTETIVEFGTEYFRGRNVSYGGRIRAGEDDTVLLLGAHWYFGASRR